MKNLNIFSIKPKFPHLTPNKKIDVSLLIKNHNSNSLIFKETKSTINNPNSLSIKPYNNLQSIPLIKSLNQNFFQENHKLLRPSTSDFYLTKIPPISTTNISSSNFINTKKSSNKSSFRIITNNKIKHNFRYKSNYSSHKNLNNEDNIIINENIKKPRLRFLGNLIKFGKEKKYIKKEVKKEIVPLETRRDYLEYITKKRKLYFNPNNTSQYVHDKRSDYLIKKITKSKSYIVLQPNYVFKQKYPKEEMIEMRDEVPSLPFNAQNLINEIRNLFSQEYKFNYIQINEEFFKNFENRINFMYDIYRVPVFKNNLVKIKLNKIDSLAFEEWKNINVINPTTWNYLNRIKTKIQREKDEELRKQKEEEIRKKEEEEEMKFLNKRKKEKEIKNKDCKNPNLSEEEKECEEFKKEEENFKNLISNIEKEGELKEQKTEDLYIIEEYFNYKKIYENNKVSIASDKLRYIFFNKQNISHKIENLIIGKKNFFD